MAAPIRGTFALYDALLAAFRADPSITAAAKAAGCSYKTAQQAWRLGWRHLARPPIRQVLEQENMLARAAIHQAQEAANREAATILERAKKDAVREAAREARDFGRQAKAEALQGALQEVDLEKARLLAATEREVRRRLEELMAAARMDAAETRAAEAGIARSARNTTLALYSMAARLLAQDHLDGLTEALKAGLTARQLKPEEAARITTALARFGHTINEMAKITLQIERIRLGEPTEVVKIDIQQMSAEEALREIDEAKALADLARRVGAVPDGKSVH